MDSEKVCEPFCVAMKTFLCLSAPNDPTPLLELPRYFRRQQQHKSQANYKSHFNPSFPFPETPKMQSSAAERGKTPTAHKKVNYLVALSSSRKEERILGGNTGSQQFPEIINGHKNSHAGKGPGFFCVLYTDSLRQHALLPNCLRANFRGGFFPPSFHTALIS